MNANQIHWMNYSIKISKEAHQSALLVGAVLVSENNELMCSSFAGEELNESWCSVLLKKVQKLKISNAQAIYITIATLSSSNSFELSHLLREVHISNIYIGLPDPKLTCYLDDDPTITLNNVYRYPEELQREILKDNEHIFADSKQSIKYSPFYSENRISNLIVEKLKANGFVISKEEITANKQKTALASLICIKYGIEYSKAIGIVYNAISDAFNYKYGEYNYEDDARSLEVDWEKKFMSVYNKLSPRSMSALNVLNVGVGSGHEAIKLFSNCKCITFVDIAQMGLQKIQEQFPLSKIIATSADDLSSIPDCIYDLYISLRTFNSSFFYINKAIGEARRVLKSNAVILVSVANGFLSHEQQCIIPGLIIPGTEFVDIYRGLDTIKQIQKEFIEAGFENIQISPTNTEIYLSAIAA